MKAVIINGKNEIIGLLNEETGNEIEVAGAIALDGSPVNRKTYKVSRSVKNLTRAARSDAQFASRHEHNGFIFFTL